VGCLRERQKHAHHRPLAGNRSRVRRRAREVVGGQSDNLDAARPYLREKPRGPGWKQVTIGVLYSAKDPASETEMRQMVEALSGWAKVVKVWTLPLVVLPLKTEGRQTRQGVER